MKNYTFEMLRTYSTLFEIEAESQQEANDKFKALGDSIYTEEMQQCEVIKEEVKGDKYARKCDKCGDGMNDGYLVYGGDEYYCSAECLHQVYTPKEWKEMYEESEENGGNDNYWTQWEDESDFVYQIINGELQEIDNL
jgi:hypothetical protein